MNLFNLNKKTNNIVRTYFLTLFVVTLSTIVSAQGVDLGYDPSIGIHERNSVSVKGEVEIQADRKILVFGDDYLNTLAGTSIQGIGRLNDDGTVDNTFKSNDFLIVNSAKTQSDGKIIVGGISKLFKPVIARLNSDGSLDPTFPNPYAGGTPSGTTLVIEGIQTDGKIVFTTQRLFFGSITYAIKRLNTDGTIDSTFSDVSFNMQFGRPYKVQVFEDNKILVAAQHTKLGKLFRLTPDGLVDGNFESPSLNLSGSPSSAYVRDFGVQSDGKLIINGNFDGVNGIARTKFARLNIDGTVDQSFSNNYALEANLEILSDDKIYVRSAIPSTDLWRLNADGTVDNSYFAIASIQNFVIDSSDRLVATDYLSRALAVKRFETTGAVDGSFGEARIGFSGEITAMKLLPDGKTLVGGLFNIADGKMRSGIARINVDGTVDDTYITPGANNTIETFAVQNDGKVLVGGRFSSFGAFPRLGIARFNADGTIDSNYFPTPQRASSSASVFAIAVQNDGKTLIGGEFETVGGTPQNGIARLHIDGSLDTTFSPNLVDAQIQAIVIQTDGKIMIGGVFNGINGSNRSNLARLNGDGTLDTGFNAGSSGSVGFVNQIFVKTDGDYFVRSSNTVTLRNSDGSIDNSFTPPTVSGLRHIVPQSDGSVIIGGIFNEVNNVLRSNVARLFSDGSLDSTFYPAGVGSGFIDKMIQQQDGKLVIGGNFAEFENVNRSSIARISIPPAIPTTPTTNFDFDGDGKADIAVFRPSENKWYVLRSSDFGVTQQVFGINGDSPLPADFDGDGKLDFSIFRNSLADWWSLSSVSGNHIFAHLGQNGDIPRPSDFDGDGKTDYVVYRPATSQWFRYGSTGQSSNVNFGTTGDKPLVGDFDGDGKSDVAIYRPSTGTWWWQSSINNGQFAAQWGISTDIPSPGDYDGDGITDFAIYRPETGVWWIYNSATQDATIIQFGLAEDKPVPADYDGDGKVDIAVYRPSTGIWYLLQSTEGFAAYQFGISSDIPIPNALIP